LEAEIYGGCVGAIDTECGGGKLTNQTVRAGHIFPSYWNDQTQPHDTLLARDYKGVGNQDLTSGRLLVPAALYENHPNDSRVTGPHDVAPSCVSRYGTGGGNVPLVQESMAFQQNTRDEVRYINGDGAIAGALAAENGAKQQNYIHIQQSNEAIAFPAAMSGTQCAKTKNLSPAICSVNQTAVAVDCYNKTIGDKSQSISSSASDINHTGGVINPADRMAVRRLTPKECERLQGFNDDHTMISWRNKPADQCPDGPRYKALGNSMAVPCMAWIGKRIDAVEKTK
jgi:DNA (cytosine-5)-methyltransferase 1